jgi:hypothetical protein
MADVSRLSGLVARSHAESTPEPIVGSVRGFRWWRLSADTELLSPWRGPVRWKHGENEASCLARQGMFGWRMSRAPHPRGCPATACECGFYALHALPSPNGDLDRAIWEIDTATSGGRHGLVLGIVAGYGRVLIGTAGWRSQFARILALFAGPTVTDHTRQLGAAAATYEVPLYRDLDVLVSEWGPDRADVASLTA